MKRTSFAVLAAVLALSTPVLTGCFSGQGATTNMQAGMNSGNGVQFDQGSLDIEDATLVLGPEGSHSATLLVTIVNNGTEADTLTLVNINGKPAYVTPGYGEIAPNGAQRFGVPMTEGMDSSNMDPMLWINTYDLDVPVSSYVPIQLGFEKAGLAEFSVLTVPAVGMYAGIAPDPATAPVG